MHPCNALNITEPSPAGELAEAIVEVAGPDGCCTDEDLIRRGFGTAQIAEHGRRAREIAREIMSGRRRASVTRMGKSVLLNVLAKAGH